MAEHDAIDAIFEVMNPHLVKVRRLNSTGNGVDNPSYSRQSSVLEVIVEDEALRTSPDRLQVPVNDLKVPASPSWEFPGSPESSNGKSKTNKFQSSWAILDDALQRRKSMTPSISISISPSGLGANKGRDCHIGRWSQAAVYALVCTCILASIIAIVFVQVVTKNGSKRTPRPEGQQILLDKLLLTETQELDLLQMTSGIQMAPATTDKAAYLPTTTETSPTSSFVPTWTTSSIELTSDTTKKGSESTPIAPTTSQRPSSSELVSLLLSVTGPMHRDFIPIQRKD